jgi:hypothetical protein
MTESAVLDKSIKTFLLGVSVGTIVATILKPREEKRLPEPARHIPARDKPVRDKVDIASEDSFPASDPPAH